MPKIGNKKGQITIFIIIGIILLIATAVVFYFQRAEVITRPKIVYPPAVNPVQTYIESCLEQLGTDAALKLGQKGGYIELPPEIDRFPPTYIKEDVFGMLKVPLWYFQGKNRKPTLEYIEYQLTIYVNNSLKDCLRGFEPLKNEYEIKEIANYSVKATIAEQDVAIELNYPLEVTIKARNELFRMEKFNSYIPVRLKYVYELASDIFDKENEALFFENMTVDLMSMNPSVPFTGLFFDCSAKIWHLYKIRDEIKNTIRLALGSVRFKNTNYIPFESPESDYEQFMNLQRDPMTGAIKKMPKAKVPDDAYLYFNLFFDIGDKNYKDLIVDVIHNKDWPFEIDARPSSGGILRSNTAKGFPEWIRFLCVQSYHFVYDVYYPVEILIRDPASFKGDGYTFRFAMPVIVKNNKGEKEPLLPSEFAVPEQRGAVCDALGNTVYDLRATDSFTYEELKDVNFSYNCFGFVCELGKSRADAGIYRLRTRIPVACAYGTVKAEKDLYISDEAQLIEERLALKLIPLKRLEFEILKQIKSGDMIREPEPLLPDETATIIVKSKSSPKYQQIRTYPDEKSIDIINNNDIYELDIILTKGDRYTGGFSGNWSVKLEDMYQKNKITFKVLQQVPYPETDLETATLMFKLSNYSEILSPEFK